MPAPAPPLLSLLLSPIVLRSRLSVARPVRAGWGGADGPRGAAVAALAALALVTGGCDRQKGADPQVNAAAASDGAAAAAGSARPRYAIDRSRAGAVLPAAAVFGPDDAPARLTTLMGKPAIVNLWATWCAPCVEELPTLNAVAAAAGDRAQVVVLSQDGADSRAAMREFLRSRGWPALAAWHDPANAVGLAAGGSLPTTLIYDAAGREVARVTGPLDWTGPEGRALLKEAGFPQ